MIVSVLIGRNGLRPKLVRALNDFGYETEAPMEIVAWTNEEGSRFSSAMVGSGVFAGVFDLAEGLARPDNVTGVTLGAELDQIGFAGPEPAAETRSRLISKRTSSKSRSSKRPACRLVS
jgi:hypothetical protein